MASARMIGLALSGAFFLAGQVGACAEVTELKVSHYLPPNHTAHKELLRWGEQLEKESKGQLTLKIYPASQLGPVQRQFDLARSGSVDIAVGLHGATPGRYPMSELASIPYAFPASGANSAVTSARLTELAPAYLAAEHAGMKILWMAVTNPLLVHTAKAQIKSVDDFKGLRIRYAGEQAAGFLRTVGATPLAVPPGETADGLAKGIIDGATFPYEAAQSFDLATVVKQTLEPGMTTATFAIVMNQAKYDALPADLKALIDRTTGVERARAFGTAWDGAEAEGRAYMLAKGVTITSLPAAEVDKIKTMLKPSREKSVADLAAAGKPAQAFVEAYQK